MRIIGTKCVKMLHVWVDTEFSVHGIMRSYTGRMMSFGHGRVHWKSRNETIKTKSTTEKEIEGTSENVKFQIWFIPFMKAQEELLDKSMIFQDNESAEKMEKNGCDSTTQRSLLFNIRYLFVKHKVNKFELMVDYYLTKLM